MHLNTGNMVVFANRDKLPDDPEKLKSICSSLFDEIVHLEEMLRLIRKQKFGSGSEQISHPGMKPLFPSESEDDSSASKNESEPKTVRSYKRSGRKKSAIPDNLPRVDYFIDLTDKEKSCQDCNSSENLKKIADKVSEKLRIIPARAEVIRYIRPVYSCSKCECIKAAPMPTHPIPKSFVSSETLTHILISKYADGLPLYRQETSLKRLGIDISRDCMSRWMIQLSDLFSKLTDLMNIDLNAGNMAQIDETYLQVLKEKNRSPVTKSFLIIKAREGPPGKNIVIFKYNPGRTTEVIQQLMNGFKGRLLSDGLGVYQTLSKKNEDIRRYGCWQHSRRKFTDALKGLSPSRRKAALASYAVTAIDRLFKVEKEAGHNPEKRLKLRKEQSEKIIEDLKSWLDKFIDSVPKKSLTGKAMHYLKNQWKPLTGFLACGLVPISNNYIENLIRPVAVGRKAWLFCDSVAGAEASANIYSLLVTAKQNNLNLWEYFNKLMNLLPTANSESDLRTLLPYS